MLTRRGFIIGGAGSINVVGQARAGEDDWQAVLAQSVASSGPLTLGRIVPPPDDPSWKEVDGLLSKAPKPGTSAGPVTPLDVATYLSASVPDKYRMAWPEPNPAHPTYANPLILRLFLSTKTVPMGDETAWCAAFVNWCLTRAGIMGTASGSSQSFINAPWGKAVWRYGDSVMPTEAKQGDIAVFRLRYDPGHGHVCFFKQISQTRANSVEVLGGNQLRGYGSAQRHLIDSDTFRVDADLALWAVLTVPGLRSV